MQHITATGTELKLRSETVYILALTDLLSIQIYHTQKHKAKKYNKQTPDYEFWLFLADTAAMLMAH